MAFPKSTIRNVRRFAALALLSNIGCVFGLFPTNALLVSHVGTASLFTAYLGSAIAILGCTGLYFLLADRVPRRRLFAASHLLAAAAVVAAWSALHAPQLPAWYYTLIRALFYGLYVLGHLQFWLLASETFSSYEAKRVYPTIIAADIAGTMLGGVLLTLGARYIAATDFLLCWAALLAGLPLLLIGLHRRSFGTPPPATITPTAPFATTWPLVLVLFGFWLTYALLCHGVDYLYHVTAVAAVPEADQLTAIFGQVTAGASIFVLCYQLGAAQRLAARFGIDRALFLIPLVIIGSCSLLVWAPTLLTAAIAEALTFFFADFASLALLQPLFNTIPRAIRGRVKICTEGFGQAAGVLCLFGLAVGGASVLTPHRLSVVLLAVAVASLALPWALHRLYMRHLVHCLRSSDHELVINAVQALGEPNKSVAAAPLLRLLHDTTQIHLQRNIVLSLGQMRSGEAFHDIVQLFAVRNESLQNAVVEALSDYRNYDSMLAIFRLLRSGTNVSLQVRMNAVMVLTRLIGTAMTPFLLTALDDADPRVQANTLDALGTLRDRKIVPVLLPFLTHPHHRVRGSAIVALWALRPARAVRLRVQHALDALYHSNDPLEYQTALYVIGAARRTSYIPDLLRLRSAADRRVRRLAAVALAQMEIHRYAKTLGALLQDSDEAFALDTAKRLGQFPATSRWAMFEWIDQQPAAARTQLLDRLAATGLDFSEEQDALDRRATLFTYAPW